MHETLQFGLATIKTGEGRIYVLDFAGNSKEGHLVSTACGTLD